MFILMRAGIWVWVQVEVNSTINGGLQVTDFVCGAFGNKYNTMKLKNDFDRYTGIIKYKLKLEKNNFFKENKTTPAYWS